MLVYARLGIELPPYADVSADELLKVARSTIAESKRGPWTPVERPLPLDVVLMTGFSTERSCARAPVHVGVMVDERRVLHVERGRNAAIYLLTSPHIRHRIVGFYRHDVIAAGCPPRL